MDRAIAGAAPRCKSDKGGDCMHEDVHGHARRLDNAEARVVERSVFGKGPTRRTKAAAYERKPVLGTKRDQSVIDAFFAAQDIRPSSDTEKKGGASTPDDIEDPPST
ncbi:hypothetical protein [Gordonibacter urolithinfaciens]|uniref:hypothetical protein n=2 Tax=Gordonibacter urolithinfaciens TaxID=1335613 RepID=UPI003AAB1C16